VKREQIPLFLTGAAAAATVVSIAAFEILMGLALVALLAVPETRQAWRWPPVVVPFVCWVALTAVSAFASGHLGGAMPQFKKFYIYLMLFLVYTAFRTAEQIRWLVIAWAAGAAASGAWSGVQLYRNYTGYTGYINARATGFMGHWMTFGGEMMMALLLIGALVLLSKRVSRGLLVAMLVCGALVLFGLLASYTRSMWLGALVGSVYLVWMWRPWMVLAIPVLGGLILLANPFGVQERAISAFRPHGDVDSNEFRVVTRQIGWEMIKAHPLLGVGPEQVGPQHEQYIPASVPRPLPTGFYGHLHNVYIHYAAERGIPAMLTLLWMLLTALFSFIRTLRGTSVNSETKWILHASIAVMLAVMVSGWYELNLGDSEVLGMVMAVMGCGLAAVSSTQRTDKP
jgi:putative inorganic carbon (hco3(-)) transporter